MLEPLEEAALLNEIARLTAALICIVRRVDDPELIAEVAQIIWPKGVPDP